MLFGMDQIQSKLAVDFYNHDTKYTDVKSGADPVYNTLFSFKNSMDAVYNNYIQSDSIVVDVISGKVKLGSA